MKFCLCIFLVLIPFFKVNLFCYGANILAIIPSPVLTHQTALRPLWRELAKRGHNITLLTTNPINDKNLTNLKEIDTSYCYAIWEEKYNVTKMVVDKEVGFLKIAEHILKANDDCVDAQLTSPQGKDLLHNPDNHFDLMFIEAQLPSMLGFSWKYNIPFIGISTLECQFGFHLMAGNEVHPITNPDINMEIKDYRHPTFTERIFSTIFIYTQRLMGVFFGPKEQQRMSKYFGKNLPPSSEIRKNMAMVFVTVNPLFNAPRAQLPNTINLWQNLAMEEPKPLPRDLDSFISKAKNGLVYFSLGSTIDEGVINATTKRSILEAFKEMPYHFLWRSKVTDNIFKDIPENVLITSKWLPQQDILRHQNTKLFITHAGINSLFETAHFGVPALAIPFFGDQIHNAARIEHLGIGLKLDRSNLTKESLKWAINTILENKRFKEKTKEIQQIFNDVDEPPLQKAVWWTEFVLRNKNVTFLKNPANRFPLWQYLQLDVMAIVLLVLFIFIYTILKSVSLLWSGAKYLRRVMTRTPKQKLSNKKKVNSSQTKIKKNL